MLKSLVRMVVVLTVCGVVGGVSYLSLAAFSLYPPAEGVAREFMSHLFAGDAGAAYELIDPAVQANTSRDAFMAEAGRREVYYAGAKGIALAAQDLDGVSRISVRGPVTYGPGLTGEATVALRKTATGWRVVSHEITCPQLLDALRDSAVKAGYAFLDAMRGGDFATLTALMDPAAVQRLGEESLRKQQAGLARRVDDSRFVEAKTRADFPRYVLHGMIRTTDGLPYEVEIQLCWKRGQIRVTDWLLIPSAAWITEQRHVARQVASNFLTALKGGSAPDMIGACHPKLVEALGRTRFEEMAQEFPAKLADIVIDDTRSTAEHPIYEIVGAQKTLEGSELPMSLRVQYVDGSYVITAMNFE